MHQLTDDAVYIRSGDPEALVPHALAAPATANQQASPSESSRI